MDPKTWKDPFAFNPDRWLDETNRLKNNPAFMPFGVGKIWSTAGFEFANIQLVQFTMSRIIVSFKFLGDLQNYTFLESLEPTEPEK